MIIFVIANALIELSYFYEVVIVIFIAFIVVIVVIIVIMAIRVTSILICQIHILPHPTSPHPSIFLALPNADQLGHTWEEDWLQEMGAGAYFEQPAFKRSCTHL